MYDYGKLSSGSRSGVIAAPNGPRRGALQGVPDTGGNSMSLVKRIRLKGTRQVGLMMAGLLVAGLAAASGTVLESSSSGSSTASTASMDSMVQSMHAKTGFTNGWYDGRTVRFFYSKNYFCRTPPASTASSKCEGGANYIRTRSEEHTSELQ